MSVGDRPAHRAGLLLNLFSGLARAREDELIQINDRGVMSYK